jgi:predicted GIY-YIG superfamily endonuclease
MMDFNSTKEEGPQGTKYNAKRQAAILLLKREVQLKKRWMKRERLLKKNTLLNRKRCLNNQKEEGKGTSFPKKE